MLTYIKQSDILSEYFWKGTKRCWKLSQKKLKKIKKTIDLIKSIWYIGNAATEVVGMFFENWAKCQFINS